MAYRLAVFIALIALLSLWASSGHTAAARQENEIKQPALAQPNRPKWLGAAGCASSACHNANGFKGELRSEYTTWVVHDLHARSYEVLLNAKSRTIVKNLQVEGGKPAHELALCLNCHVHKDYEQADHHPRFTKEDGVSCESCHGPAGDWISEHYKTGWNRKGMWDTRSLTGRVQTCTPCHVGAAGMEVNHDLIAAGHPRLAFEFSAYHSLMPHHWQDAKDKQAGLSPWARDDWDAAAFYIGQALAAKASVDLLATRASGKIWPEFAEYDCYACHHRLQGQSWRQDPSLIKSGSRKLGSLLYNEWYLGSASFAILPGKVQAVELQNALAKLKEVMESSASPNRQLVHKQAEEASKALETWAKQCEARRFSPQELSLILRKLADRAATQPANSWDEAAQTYLALVAVHQSLRDAPKMTDEFKRIRDLLQFPPDSQSPPLSYTPRLLLNQYDLLRKRLGGMP